MANEDQSVVPQQDEIHDSPKYAIAWKRREARLTAGARAEELPCIAEKMEQAAKLFAEVAGYLEKVAPKHKRLLDETKMQISHVGMLLRQYGEESPCVHRVLAPIPGIVILNGKRIGHEVKKGEVVLTLEAMKMENPIMAPAAGKIVSLPYGDGQKVAKGAVLAVISNDGHLKVINSSPERR